MTKYTPRNDHVLIQPDGGETRRGKILIPASAVTVPSKGTVAAVGPGYVLADGTRAALDLQVNDRVDFVMHGGTQQRDIDGEVYYLMKEADIIAIIADEPQPEVAMPGDDDDDVEDGVGTSTSIEGASRLIVAGDRR